MSVINIGSCDILVSRGPSVCVQQGLQGVVTLAMFSALFQQYLDALPRFRSVEQATGAPNNLVAGEAFIWANDTDVGIAGGLTTVPVP